MCDATKDMQALRAEVAAMRKQVDFLQKGLDFAVATAVECQEIATAGFGHLRVVEKAAYGPKGPDAKAKKEMTLYAEIVGRMFEKRVCERLEEIAAAGRGSRARKIGARGG